MKYKKGVKCSQRGHVPWNKGLTKHTDRRLMNISKSTSKQMKREYKLGIRDKNKITRKANEKTRQLVKEGKWILQKQNRNFEPWSKGLTKYEHSGLMKISKSKLGDNNPVRKYPEKHPNRIMAKNQKFGRGYISKGQWELFHKIKERFPDAEINFRIRVKDYVYFVDVAIPSLSLVVEYDGGYWHKKPEEDKRRQKRIESLGLKLIRVTDKDDLDKFVKNINCRSDYIRVVSI